MEHLPLGFGYWDFSSVSDLVALLLCFFSEQKIFYFFFFFFFSPLCFFLTLMIFEVIGVRSLVEHLQASRYKVFSGAGRTSSKGLAERAFVHRPTEVLVSR